MTISEAYALIVADDLLGRATGSARQRRASLLIAMVRLRAWGDTCLLALEALFQRRDHRFRDPFARGWRVRGRAAPPWDA